MNIINTIRSIPIYPNNLKNREFGKEAPQNFRSEQATIAERQGASENENDEAKPSQPKTDSSSCLGITILNIAYQACPTTIYSAIQAVRQSGLRLAEGRAYFGIHRSLEEWATANAPGEQRQRAKNLILHCMTEMPRPTNLSLSSRH